MLQCLLLLYLASSVAAALQFWQSSSIKQTVQRPELGAGVICVSYLAQKVLTADCNSLNMKSVASCEKADTGIVVFFLWFWCLILSFFSRGKLGRYPPWPGKVRFICIYCCFLSLSWIVGLFA